MYYWGIQRGQRRTVFALIKKFQKNVKKHYALISIEQHEGQVPDDELLEKISNLYHGRQYMIRKRLFSQEKRPSKTALVNPGIIIGFHGKKESDIMTALKRKRVMAESIVIEKNGRGHREEQARLGRIYHVPGQDLLDAVISAAEQGRFILDVEFSLAGDTIHNMTRQQFAAWVKAHAARGRVSDEVKFAVSLPIWFREAIRYYRAYSA